MPASCATRGLSVKGNFCQLRFLFYCKSQTEEICLRIPQLCFSLLCHMELRLGVRDDRIGFSKIVLVRSTSWEIVGLDTNKSHALWTAANRVRRLRKGTNMSFATFSWQRWPLSLSLSLYFYVSHSSSLLLALILSLRIFPLHSLTNKKTSCFWPLSFTKGHLIITALLTALSDLPDNTIDPPNQALLPGHYSPVVVFSL